MPKYLTSTYLRDVLKYEFEMFFDKEVNSYITIKYIEKIVKPFILNEEGESITILDDGYFIIEIVPLDKKFICRVHIDSNFKIIERFFVMTDKNMLKFGIPAYEDLKLSIVCLEEKNKIYNMDVFEMMLNVKTISKKTHENTLGTINNLLKEINSKTNKIYNLDVLNYLGSRRKKCK